MALKRTPTTSHSPTTIPRVSSDIAMTRTSIPTPPPPLSSCMPATSLNPKSSRWLPHIMPIEGSDAIVGDRTVMYKQLYKVILDLLNIQNFC